MPTPMNIQNYNLRTAMGILTNIFGKRSGTGAEPWVTDSIYRFIEARVDLQTGRYDAQGQVLPDVGEDATAWADGALDGVLGHHGASEESNATGQRLASLIDRIARTGDARAVSTAYELLKEVSVLAVIDPVLEYLGKRRSPFEPYLSQFALQLATHSADRGPVKVGIALLGAMRLRQHEPLISTLGKHEEFTLYAAAALINMFEDPTARLWALARKVEGWGRIQVVERLVPTKNTGIQQWLRREGFRNSVMYEYLALTAAVHGRLREALEQAQVPDADLNAAGEIIAAMITADAGPAPGMNSYADAAVTCQLYLGQISRVPGDLVHMECAQQIQRYVAADTRDAAERMAQGWSDAARAEVVKLARAYISGNEWPALIREQLGSNDIRVFERASRAAQQVGIDAFEWNWRRVCAMPRSSIAWLHAMEGANSDRIDQLLELAQRELPLQRIGASPAAQVRDATSSEVHACLELVLQRLKDFPGKGTKLIGACLRSPLARHRNMAINALAALDVGTLSKGAQAMIERALSEETDPQIRVRLVALRDRS